MKALVILAAALTCAVAAVGAVPQGRAIQPGPALIRVTATLASDEYVNLDHVQTWLLYNRKVSRFAIGNEIITCRYLGKGGILADGASWCEGSVALKRGRLTFQGRRYASDYYRQTVVGGTGVYVNVAGQLTATQTGPSRAVLVFTLEAF